MIIILKSNKILLACIILLAIFTIGAVSAADENISESDNDILSIDSADENVIENSAGDFSELTDLINQTAGGKTLYLDKDYVRTEHARIVITNPITIDGQGHTIDAEGTSHYIFYVRNPNVILKNINFVDCDHTFVYSVVGKCSVYNCSFVDCTPNCAVYRANAYNCSFLNTGGGLSDGNAYNCSFINCNGRGLSDGNAYNCSFIKCNSNYDGGAINNGDAYSCSFIDCHSESYGGAIYSGNAYDCSFVNCTTKDNSATIYNGSASNCNFTNCSACIAIYSVHTSDVSYGSNANVYVYGDSNAGDVNVMVNGETKKVTPSRAGSSVYFSNLEVGTYDVEISYAGKENFEGQRLTCSFKVKKRNPMTRIMVQNPYISYNGRYNYTGQNSTLIISKNHNNIPGYFNVTINGVSQKVSESGYTVSVPLGVLNEGSYDIKVSYDGSANFNAQSKSLSFKIDRQDAITRIHVDYPQIISSGGTYQFTYHPSRLYVDLKSGDVPGSINVTINGASYIRNTTGRTAISFSLGIMKPGPYDIKVSYDGGKHFNAQTETLSFKVVKANPMSHIRVQSHWNNYYSFDNASSQIEYKIENATLYIIMKQDYINLKYKYAPGNLHVTVNGASYKTISISRSPLSLPLGILNVGANEIKVTYSGSAYFTAQNITLTMNVVKANPINSVEFPNLSVGNTIIKVNMANDRINGNVWFTISDENNNKILSDKIHIEDGYATLPISNLKAGKYHLHVYYAGNLHYNAQIIKSEFEVSRISPGLSVAKTTVDGKTVLTASVAADTPGNVKFEVNGTTYKAKIVNGVATLTLPDMAPGTYTLKSSYGGNYKYLPETKTRTITIK